MRTPPTEPSAPPAGAGPVDAWRAWLRPMVARNPAEEHRVATPLELLFDLCFVVAVSQAATQWRHALAVDRVGPGLLNYLAVFFAIWWAWMHFTWFASVYDTDDLLYRGITLVQITGGLILAAGVPRAFDPGDYTVLVVGWGVMRLGLVFHWLRAAHRNPAGRRTARRYAAGLAACWAGWAVLVHAPHPWWPALAPLMILAELAVPLWARLAGANPWHPRHIAERFGGFTLIVLGESVLASTTAFQAALTHARDTTALDADALGGLLTLFAMWWLYFARPAHHFLLSSRTGFEWGYGHLPIFTATAAVGSGLGAVIDQTTGHSALPVHVAAVAFTLPVAVFVLSVWLLQLRPHHTPTTHSPLFVLTAVVILGLSFTGAPILGTGLAMTALAVLHILTTPPSGPHDALSEL